MPARLFNLSLGFARIDSTATVLTDQFARQRQQHQEQRSKRATVSTLEIRRPSMDHLMRPALLGKKHNSGDRKRDGASGSRGPLRSRSKDKHLRDSTDAAAQQPPPVAMELVMESPPALMLDAPQHSSGALISGRLQVTARKANVRLQTITMYLECTTTTERPVQARCRACATQGTDLYEWHFLSKPQTFAADQGVHDLPFSHLIPGHLPPTTHGLLGSIDYSLHVRARTADGAEVELRRELVIRRALRAGSDKHSVRVFPPTHLTLHVTLPAVVHPTGEFRVHCRLSGISSEQRTDDDAHAQQTHNRWRVRKLTWRIEEHERVVAPACPAHAARVGGDGKGVQHEHTRDVGAAELKHGWKTDLSEGVVEADFAAALDPAVRPQCGLDAANGMRVSHSLVLELVIAEESAPARRPDHAVPTGAARVLRTQFALHVADRAGLGIPWNEEQPPVYDDVPESPPHYPNSVPVGVPHPFLLRGRSDLARTLDAVDDDAASSSATGAAAEIPPDSPPHYQSELTSISVYSGDDLLDEEVGALTLDS